MRVLALDTTRLAGSVALVDDDRIIQVRASDPNRSHAERLPTDVMRLLADADIPLSSVDLFAVSAGPGSFTGLRIGIATMQGFAFEEGKPMVAVSTLEAIAHAAAVDASAGSLIASWMDAHRRDVFAALYQVTDAPIYAKARLVAVEPPTVGDPAEILSRWSTRVGTPVVFAGDGATKYADRLAEAARVFDPPLLAGTIGLMAAQAGRAGETIHPAQVQALYIRRPDAEIARDKEHASETRR
jgi:tRNA threonylcarbamoyladenosine biosynthesis protein TsaB